MCFLTLYMTCDAGVSKNYVENMQSYAMCSTPYYNLLYNSVFKLEQVMQVSLKAIHRDVHVQYVRHICKAYMICCIIDWSYGYPLLVVCCSCSNTGTALKIYVIDYNAFIEYQAPCSEQLFIKLISEPSSLCLNFSQKPQWANENPYTFHVICIYLLWYGCPQN